MIGKINKTHSTWLLIASIVMIALGAYVWFNPATAMIALALYLGIAFICIGATYIWIYRQTKTSWYLALGIVDVLVGLVFVLNLGVTAASIPMIFAFWALFVGIMQLTSGFEMKEAQIPNWKWLALSGLISILFAFAIFYFPMIGAITITILMGSYLVMYGILGLVEYQIMRKI